MVRSLRSLERCLLLFFCLGVVSSKQKTRTIVTTSWVCIICFMPKNRGNWRMYTPNQQISIDLAHRKLTNVPQKRDHFKRTWIIFQPLIFRGHSLVFWGVNLQSSNSPPKKTQGQTYHPHITGAVFHSSKNNWAVFKTPMTVHYTDWFIDFIGILILAYYNPQTWIFGRYEQKSAKIGRFFGWSSAQILHTKEDPCITWVVFHSPKKSK